MDRLVHPDPSRVNALLQDGQKPTLMAVTFTTCAELASFRKNGFRPIGWDHPRDRGAASSRPDRGSAPVDVPDRGPIGRFDEFVRTGMDGRAEGRYVYSCRSHRLSSFDFPRDDPPELTRIGIPGRFDPYLHAPHRNRDQGASQP